MFTCKKFHRYLALVLALIMLIALSACGGSGSPALQQTTVASANSEASTQSATQAETQTADQIEAQPATQPETQSPAQPDAEKTQLYWMCWGHPRNIEIKMEAMEKSRPDLYDKYELIAVVAGPGPGDLADRLRLTLASNETLPDIAQLSSDLMPEFVQAGVLADLSDQYTDAIKANLTDGALELVTFDGKQYAYVYMYGLLSWVYRSDLFAEAGINVADIKDVDDLIEAGKKFHQHFPDKYITNFVPEMAAGGDMGRFVWILSGNGGRYVDEAGNYIFNADPGVRAALLDLKKLYDSGVCVNISEWTPDWEQGFADGTIASSLIASWIKDAAFMSTYAPDTAGLWDVALFPDFGGAKGGGSQFGGSVTFIMKDAPHAKEAIEVMTAMVLDKDGALANYVAAGGGLPPVLKDAFNDPIVSKPDPFWGTRMWEMEQEMMKSFKVFPFTPASMLEDKIIAPYVQRYLRGEIELDNMLNSVNNDLLLQIGNPYDLN